MASIWTDFKDMVPKPKPKQQTDPLAFLNSINTQGPSSADLYADALSQVGGAYQAQIDNLGQQESQTKARAKKGDAQLDAMYRALQKDIGANAGNLKGIYGGATGAASKNTANTKNAINAQYSQTNNELGQLFKRLGIQAAAPDALAGGNQDRNLLAGLVDASGASARNALEQNQAAALSFNTAQQNIAGLTGKNRRADLMDQLNETLAGIGQQRNTLYGQMSDAVSQRQYQLENDALQRQQQMQDMMFRMQQQELEMAASGAQGGLSPSQQYAMMGPSERAANKAGTLFGNEGSYAMQLLTGVAHNQNGGIYQNPGHFIRSILAENEKQRAAGNPYLDPNELEALASYYWSEGGTGKTPPRQDYSSLMANQ